MLSPAVCAAPLRQALRRHDGVRGVFARAAVPRGAVLLTLPLSYCYFPDGLPSRRVRGVSSSSLLLHRSNRAVALFPEAWVWLRRFATDAPHDRVCLEASASVDAPYATDDDDDSSAAASSSRRQRVARVVTVSVSPVEAALTACVALRYFFAHTLALSCSARARLRVGPAPDHPVAERCVQALPMTQYVQHGVESAYVGSSSSDDDAEAYTHTCLEQIAHNVRDALLTYASADEYRLMDRHPAELDAVVLSALYVVRARVLQLPWLPPAATTTTSATTTSTSTRRARADVDTTSTVSRPRRGAHARGARNTDDAAAVFVRVFAPGVYALNHSRLPTAAAVVAPARRAVVVRALQPLRVGDELTLDYKAHRRHGGGDDNGNAARPHDGRGALAVGDDAYDDDAHNNVLGDDDDDYGSHLDDKDWWESRYLLNDTPPTGAETAA